jgi:hypothetical protein
LLEANLVPKLVEEFFGFLCVFHLLPRIGINCIIKSVVQRGLYSKIAV